MRKVSGGDPIPAQELEKYLMAALQYGGLDKQNLAEIVGLLSKYNEKGLVPVKVFPIGIPKPDGVGVQYLVGREELATLLDPPTNGPVHLKGSSQNQTRLLAVRVVQAGTKYRAEVIVLNLHPVQPVGFPLTFALHHESGIDLRVPASDRLLLTADRQASYRLVMAGCSEFFLNEIAKQIGTSPRFVPSV